MTAPAESDSYDVFVSYAKDDRAWVHGYLFDAFDQAGIRYRDSEVFVLGTPMISAIQHAVQNRRVVAVFSNAYVAERWNGVLNIMSQSSGEEAGTWPLVPVVIDDVELPTRVNMLVKVDLQKQESWERGIKRLCEQLGQPLRGKPSREIPECPYPGMRPFTEQRKGFFFGRDDEIQELVELVRIRPLVTVIGPSGSGKSSLVLAGVAPRLSDVATLGERAWQTTIVRPGASLCGQLTSSFGLDADATPAALIDAISEIGREQRLLLIIDQLEEIFTDDSTDDADIAALLDGLAPYDHVRIITTVRADFYGKLMDSALWPYVNGTTCEVVQLHDRSLRDALVEPAESVGVYVEAALTERLVRDAAGEPGLMPFIQETMVTLWHRIERRLLTLDGYEALVLPRIGYETAGQTGLQVAISRHADMVMDSLSGPQQSLARRVFLRLTQFGEGKSHTRRRLFEDDLAKAAESDESFHETIDVLTDQRLLTKDTAYRNDELAATVDLSHEALITGWPSLAKWIDEKFETEVGRRRLRSWTDDWNDRDAGLLDSLQLQSAELLLKQVVDAEIGIDDDIEEFIEASRDDVRKKRRIRTGVQTAMAVLFLLAVVLAAAATQQWFTARAEARRAESLLIASNAVDLPTEDIDLAVLLSLEAMRRSETVESRAALKTTLDSPNGTPELLTLLNDHPAEVFDVDIDPNGSTFATVGSGPTGIIWNIETLTPQASIAGGHTDEIMTVSYSPTGDVLATGSRDGTFRLWNAATGEAIDSYSTTSFRDSVPQDSRCRLDDADADDIRAVAFSPVDGSVLAVAGHNTLIELWDLETGLQTGTLQGHVCDIYTIAWSPDGTVIASGSRDDTIRLWNVETGTEIAMIGTVDTDPKNTSLDVRSVVFDDTGTYLAAGVNDGSVRLFDAASAEELWSQTVHTARVFSVDFSPDGTLASAGRDQSIEIWDVDLGETRGPRRVGHRSSVRGLAFLLSGNLLSVSNDKSVGVWQIDRDFRLGNEVLVGGATPTVVTATLDRFVFGTSDGSLIRPGESPERDNPGHEARVVDIVMLDGETTASIDATGIVVIDGEAQRSWRAHDSSSTPTAVANLGEGRIATADRSGLIKIWDTGSPGTQATLQVQNCELTDIASSGRGILAASCSVGAVWLWQIIDGSVGNGVLAFDRSGVHELAFAKDGAELLGATVNGEFHRWQVTTYPRGLELVATPNAAGGNTLTIAVDPVNDDRVATGLFSGEVNLWDLDSSLLLGEPWRLPGSVRSLAISSDGMGLVAVLNDGRTFSFNIDEKSWQGEACTLAGRNLTDQEWEQYVRVGEPVATCPESEGG